MDHWQQSLTHPTHQAQTAGYEIHRDNRYLTMNRGPAPSSSSYLPQPEPSSPYTTTQAGQYTHQGPSPFETQQRRDALRGNPYDDRYYDRYVTHPQTRGPGWESSSKSHFTYLFFTKNIYPICLLAAFLSLYGRNYLIFFGTVYLHVTKQQTYHPVLFRFLFPQCLRLRPLQGIVASALSKLLLRSFRTNV